MSPRIEAPGAARTALDPERLRLRDADERGAPWRLWGPYLADREWGTVREDYSADGSAWDYFPHDHARSRAYRWVEDGLLGISDSEGRLCFALALWNETDPILKERLFGLTGPEGNHGEDVKECYWHLDATPTNSYLRALYRYPHRRFPYEQLVGEGKRRSRDEPEFELADTGVFDGNRYVDVQIEYAKVDVADLVIRITAFNRGPDPAPLHLLPTIWMRNTWSWGEAEQGAHLSKPALCAGIDRPEGPTIKATVPGLGRYWLSASQVEGNLVRSEQPVLLFTENETNAERVWGTPNASAWVKDGIDRCVVHGETHGVNPALTGTKAAVHAAVVIAAGGTVRWDLRLSAGDHPEPPTVAAATIEQRKAEADLFYRPLSAGLNDDERHIQRAAFAGLLWTKQFYHFDVREWIQGDPTQPTPPAGRRTGRNSGWPHLNAHEVFSMPDGWEYPWYAAWDLAFHCIPLAYIDPASAKEQLLALCHEWQQHPNGQLPAYEWAFGDVNPPLHAWAAWHIYTIEQQLTSKADRAFLERAFHKLLLNFTWWVNRKDAHGRNVFQGGFLGLDNIGVFDRSAALPTGGHLEQADGTAWMGSFCLQMLVIAIELARDNMVYQDLATKFFEHFLYIAEALNNLAGDGIALWDDVDEFFYDVLHWPDDRMDRLRVRSIVGLLPLLAVQTIEPATLGALPEFRERLEWFLENRPDLAKLVSRWQEPGMGARRLLALTRGHRTKRLLQRMLDPAEFLSDYGIRSLSKAHAAAPFLLDVDGMHYEVSYAPGESPTSLYGGNSNWRGPIWFPLNYILIDALRRHYQYYGDEFTVELPYRPGERASLDTVADELAARLISLFTTDDRRGVRPGSGQEGQGERLLLFHEYFHGDTGEGLGASHQTGWTALVAVLLADRGAARVAQQRSVGMEGTRHEWQ